VNVAKPQAAGAGELVQLQARFARISRLRFRELKAFQVFFKGLRVSLASTTVFEVRPGAGSAVNGGGFVPGSSGTDWSQQNAAQYSVADGVLNGTATVTSATAGFGADVVGNIVYIAGAWYQIVSRTNATTIVLDRATGSGTGQTINIGGALDLCATAEPLLTAGMTLWIKAGTQTITSNLALANSGDSTNGPISWRGYDQVRGDHTGNRPLITASTNSVDLIRGSTSQETNCRIFDNINWSSTAGTPGNGICTGTGAFGMRFLVVSNCKISGVKNGFIGDNATYNSFLGLYLANVEITSCTVDGIRNTSAPMTFDGCYVHGNAGYGLNLLSNPGTPGSSGIAGISFNSSVFYSNSLGGANLSEAGVLSTSGCQIVLDHSVFVSNGGDGVKSGVANANLVLFSSENCIVYGNSGYGVNITNAAALVVVNRNNAYGNNTSGARNNLAAGTNDVTLTADPFTARTGNDFTLNTTAGGGAACRGAGFPGAISGLVTAGGADIGALQSAATGGATNILCPPRRVYVSRPATIIRRSPGQVSRASQPIFSRTRIRAYPVCYPVTRRVSGAAVLPPPVLVSSVRKVR
jgi:hypothetical protein